MLLKILDRYRAAYAGLPAEIWLLAVVMFVNRCGSMVLTFMTLYLTSQIGLHEAAAGQMVAVHGLGAVCGAYVGGRLVERVGAIRLQMLAMFGSLPWFALLPWLHDWRAIAAALFVLSVHTGAVRPANATAIAKLTTRETRLRAFALQRLAANLGFSFGPAIGGMLAQIDFRLLFFADGGTTLLAALGLWRFFGWRKLPGKFDGQLAAPTRISPLKDPTLAWYLALFLLSLVVFFQFGSTYPLYLRDHFGFDERQIGLMYAINTLTIVAFEMVLIDWIRHWHVLRTIGWGCGLSCLAFGLLPYGNSGWYAVFAMVVLTAGEMLWAPLSVGYVAERSPAGSEGPYMGWYTLTFALAAVIGPSVGALLYAIDPQLLWGSCLAMGVALAAGFRLLARWVDGRTPPAPLPAPHAP
jgi:predicted MFS family arabinose efflux permease